MHGGDVRVGHVRDEANAGREEARVFLGAGDGLGEFGVELAADGRNVNANLLEHFAGHLATHAATARFSARVGAVPRGVGECGIRSGLALDRLEGNANAVTQGFEPVAGGLLLVVEGKHGGLFAVRHRGRKHVNYTLVMSA